MNALNNQQVQNKEQSKSWVQEWLERSAEASKRMATDEAFRQEVAFRATGGMTFEQKQALVAKHLAEAQAKTAK